jgi:hypothetical protein
LNADRAPPLKAIVRPRDLSFDRAIFSNQALRRAAEEDERDAAEENTGGRRKNVGFLISHC